MMNKIQVDKGAIRFILGGANIMCPGITSKGGKVFEPLDSEQPVAIYAEVQRIKYVKLRIIYLYMPYLCFVQGKENAMAIGLTKMSTDTIAKVNSGIAVETVHYLMDGLWQTKTI